MFLVISHFLFIMKWNMKKYSVSYGVFCALPAININKDIQKQKFRLKFHLQHYHLEACARKHVVNVVLEQSMRVLVESGKWMKIYNWNVFALCIILVWVKVVRENRHFLSFHEITCFVTKVTCYYSLRCCICWDFCFIHNMKIVWFCSHRKLWKTWWKCFHKWKSTVRFSMRSVVVEWRGFFGSWH